MQNIVIDKPYRFIPPHRGRVWPVLLRPLIAVHLRRHYGIDRIDCLHAERLAASIQAGHAIIVAPNHCRDSDPLLLSPLIRAVGTPFYFMASWHIFMQSRSMRWYLRRLGAFSIYREGMDRSAINLATEILESAERPLVIFPEGAVSRTNDRLNALMDGVALIARTAARKRAKLSPAGKVVIHPVAIRYRFHGDLERTLAPVLDDIESRLTWRPQRQLPLIERIYKLGLSLLALKELEYLGQAQTGPIAERLARLIDHILVPLEKEWLGGPQAESVIARVKRLRAAILPDMVKGDIAEEERQRRWMQLADVYLAQQLAQYPPDYIADNPTPDRLLETVERFEEDLTDVARVHRPMSATVQVGEAIEVSPTRERSDDGDPIMTRVEQQLTEMLGVSPAAAGV